MRPDSNLPLLFDRVGHFLYQFEELRRLRSKPEEFFVKFDGFVSMHSPSDFDNALAAFNEIVDTIYYGRAARGCHGAVTQMGRWE